MRPILYFVLAAALQVPTALYAQQVTVGGWVDRVDPASGTLTLRTFGNPRTIQIAPNATVRLNGVVVRLDQLPRDSDVTVIAEKGQDGALHAVQINARGAAGSPAASYPAGSVITGRLVGINIPSNQITVRTTTGDFAVPLAEAPIMVNGARGSSRDLRLGQAIQVERALPTAGSTEYVTQMIRVLPASVRGAASPAAGQVRAGAAATGAGVVERGTSIAASRSWAAVRSRTRGYRRTYRSHRASSRHRARRMRSRARHGTRRHWIRRSSAARSSFITTSPASGVVTGVAGPSTVVYANPGVVYVAPGVVSPGTSSAVGAGTAATGAADARRQSGAASNAAPNPRLQLPAQPAGAAPPAAPGRGVPSFGARVPARR
jgi:hypothetical protein